MEVEYRIGGLINRKKTHKSVSVKGRGIDDNNGQDFSLRFAGNYLALSGNPDFT